MLAITLLFLLNILWVYDKAQYVWFSYGRFTLTMYNPKDGYIIFDKVIITQIGLYELTILNYKIQIL